MKQIIVVNESLKLPRGKLAAQVAHAAVQGFIHASPRARDAWMADGMPKVVLRCSSESELRDLHAEATRRGVPAALIEDAGRTVVEPGTVTCLALGPDDDDALDGMTGALKLVR